MSIDCNDGVIKHRLKEDGMNDTAEKAASFLDDTCAVPATTMRCLIQIGLMVIGLAVVAPGTREFLL